MKTIEEQFIEEHGFKPGDIVTFTDLADYYAHMSGEDQEPEYQKFAGATGTIEDVEVDMEDDGDGESGPRLQVNVCYRVRMARGGVVRADPEEFVEASDE